MKITRVSAFAALTLTLLSGAGAAHAEGEGNGEPFAFHVPGIATAVGPVRAIAATPQSPVPMAQAARVLPSRKLADPS